MVRTGAFMTKDVETVHRDDHVDEVLERLAQADFEGFPVVDDDEQVGRASCRERVYSNV